MPFVRATKEQVRLRLALGGVGGAGKTFSALSIAEELSPDRKIAGLDTERGSMSLYADLFTFDVDKVAPPYDPKFVIQAVTEAERGGYEVLIIDSLSHFWQGEGGVLDKVDTARARYGGNQYMAWAVGTPLYQHMIDTILGADLHVICTLREKQEYVETVKDGKKSYERTGTSPVMREGIEYEFTVTASIDLEHRMTIDKTRAHMLDGRRFQPGQEKDLAVLLKDWMSDGVAPAGRAEIEALIATMNAIVGEDARRDVKTAFREEFGLPNFLKADRLDAAIAFVDSAIAGNPDPPRGGGLPLTTTDSERATTDDRVLNGTPMGIGVSTEGAPGTYIERRYDEFETGDSDPGAPPIDPADEASIPPPPADEHVPAIPPTPRPKPTPSARQLEAAGATEEIIAEGILAASKMDVRAVRDYLAQRSMATNGTKEDGQRRVAAQWAYELAQEAPGATVTDIGAPAPDEGVTDPQALMDSMRAFTPEAPALGMVEGECLVCGVAEGFVHHVAKHDDAEIVHPNATAFRGEDGQVHWSDEVDAKF